VVVLSLVMVYEAYGCQGNDLRMGTEDKGWYVESGLYPGRLMGMVEEISSLIWATATNGRLLEYTLT
jgi:hypothetical protein